MIFDLLPWRVIVLIWYKSVWFKKKNPEGIEHSGFFTGISSKMNIPALATGEQALRWLRLVCDPIFKTQSVLSGFDERTGQPTTEKEKAGLLSCFLSLVKQRLQYEAKLFVAHTVKFRRLSLYSVRELSFRSAVIFFATVFTLNKLSVNFKKLHKKSSRNFLSRGLYQMLCTEKGTREKIRCFLDAFMPAILSIYYITS